MVWRLHKENVPHDVGDGPWDDDLRDVGGAYLDARGEFLAAEVEGAVVAMGAVRGLDDERAEVKRIRVDPAYRRRGLGEAILRGLQARARELGYGKLVLDTAADAEAAQRLFEKLGYQRTGVTVLAGIDTLLYEKELD